MDRTPYPIPFVLLLGALAGVFAACGSESSGKRYDGAAQGAGGAAGSTQTGVGSGGGPGMDAAAGGGGALAYGGTSGSGGIMGAGGRPDVAAALDSGVDAPSIDGWADGPLDAPAVDAGVDLAGQPCGDATCSSNQACAQVGGGPQPPCVAPTDAGTCPDDMFQGLVLVPSCSQTGGSYHHPGCSTPPPTPRCYDLPDGCTDYCSCACPARGGGACYPGPGYFFCSYP
jgi:hypothetical protein